MLSEAKIVGCLQSADCTGVVRMSFESGPYCIDRPTIKASRFAEQIESAACAERDARIAELVNTIEKGKDLMGGMALKVAELEQQLEEARKDAEMYRWLRDYHIGDDPESINLKKAKTKGLDAAIRAAIKEQT